MAFIENGSNYLALLNLTTVTADEIISPYLTVDVLTVETELITPSINFSGTGFFATPIRQSLTGPNFLTYNTTTNEITSVLQKLNIKPEKILTDNGGQFREQWRMWCKENELEAVFAHPYYPQDKGKVERTNRNIGEELISIK